MRPERNRMPLIRTSLAACAILLILGSPAFSYTWLGPFLPPNTSPNITPPTETPSVPPIFTWIDQPPIGGTLDSSPPTVDIVPQTTPEPSTIIAGLIGAGTLGLVRIWRKRLVQPLAA